MSTVQASNLPLVALYAPMYFGTVLATAFYGITCMQTFFYYVHYQDDVLPIKIIVAATWAINTLHEALVVSGAYKYFMAGLASPSLALFEPTELVAQLIPTGLSAVLTQGFLVYRIYMLNGKRLFVPIIWLILGTPALIVTLTVYVGKTISTANSGQFVAVTELAENSFITTLGTISLSVVAAEDVLIAMFMTFLLVREYRRTDLARTAHILQRLTVFAVNTGTWTALFALVSLICVHALPFPTKNFYNLSLIPPCSVYCNTLLANLNARAYISTQATDFFSITPSVPAINVDNNQTQLGGVGLSSNVGVWRAAKVVTSSSDARQSVPSTEVASMSTTSDISCTWRSL